MDILRGLDAKEKEIDLKIKPDGTRKYPARTCYDLFLDHKSYKSGRFFLHHCLPVPGSLSQWRLGKK